MKRILFSLLLLFASFAIQAQEISIPTPIIDQIILDLHELKELRIVKQTQDSVIFQYEVELENRKNAIIEAKVTVDQYKELTERLEISLKEREKANKQQTDRISRLKLGHALRTIAEVVVVVVIIVIAL